MAAAIVPLVELGLTEIPVLVPEFMKIISAVKTIIHKPAGTAFTPAQATAAQTAALALAKPVVAAVVPSSAGTITDPQISAFIETLYQMQKAAPVTPASTTTVTNPAAAWMELTLQMFSALSAIK